MASHFLLTCLLIGCGADIPQDASDATCSHKNGQVCPVSKSAEEDAAMSFIQTQIRLAPVEDLPDAVLVEKPQESEEDKLLPDELVLGQDTRIDCATKLARLDNLNGQELTSGVDDPLFPSTATSIAEPGIFCGDTAAGLHAPCSKYNSWKTFEEVAAVLVRPYSIIGPSGITFNDIQQGELGNCYFLSALASIASVNPNIIQNMFVETWLWSSGIFKTKWLINGKESIIAVDNKIPAGAYNTYFTHPSLTGEWWPVVLAKSWAKIFGSFKAAESGYQSTVVNAITRSPSTAVETASKTDAAIWELLMTAKSKKYPMYASTSSAAQYGLVKGHAYSILKPYNHPVYGQVVKCYNPWGSDKYKGAIPNNPEINGDKPGVFTIALSEFRGAFAWYTYNQFIDGYKVTALADLSPGSAVYDLSVSYVGKFWVSVVWPMQRIVDGCGEKTDGAEAASLSAQLTTKPGKSLGTKQFAWSGAGRVDYEFPGSEYVSAYDLFASVEFKASFLKTYTLSVYAPGDVTLAKSTKCLDNPAGLSPKFPDVACSQTNTWSNTKCTGENSEFVQKQCRKTCGLCSGTSGGGGGGAGTPCEDSTTYTDPGYSMSCSLWSGFKCSGYSWSTDLETNCPLACKICTA